MASKCSQEELQEYKSKKPASWDDCPNEILLMILDMLPLPAIAICLFVNRKWNSVCHSILDMYNLWPELVDIHVPHKGEPLLMKTMGDWDQIYWNTLLWNHVEKASVHFMDQSIVDHSVRQLNVYRNNLIVINSAEVRYFSIPELKLTKEFAAACTDFVENDSMIVHVSMNWDGSKKVKLLGKSSPDDFNMDYDSAKDIIGVWFYRVVKNTCYIMTRIGMLSLVTYNHPDWTEVFLGRYYGTPESMIGFNVYDDNVYVWLSNGAVVTAEPTTKKFKTVMQINMQFKEKQKYKLDYMFHMFGFVSKVREERAATFRRYGLMEYSVFTLECPRLTSVLEHGDMVILGKCDGTIEFYRPRDVKYRSAVMSISLKTYLTNHHATRAVIAMEAYEEKGKHHLFAATISRVYHFVIEHVNGEKYMWSEFPMTAQMLLGYNTEGKKCPPKV